MSDANFLLLAKSSYKKVYNSVILFELTIINFSIGGWLRVGRIVTTAPSIASYSGGLSVMSTSFQDLYKSAAENYLLSGDALNNLRSIIGFSEVRVYCTKPYHGRINHAKFSTASTAEEALFNYAIKSSSIPVDLCNALQYMPDDNSVTKVQPCSSLRPSSTSNNQRLYNFIWYVSGKTHITVMSPSRMDCDDYNDAGYNNFGTWLFHVR